jgi:catechol 2,3-dioxygenase-like lactoylglutathione lyase family enzyme
MFTHIVLGTNNVDRSRKFYDQVLAPLGVRRLVTMEHASMWGAQAPQFMVTRPANGKKATSANGGTVSFAAPTRGAVDAFYKSAVAQGGQCEGPPGSRPAAGPTAYAAYVRDLDGNKICAYCFALA